MCVAICVCACVFVCACVSGQKLPEQLKAKLFATLSTHVACASSPSTFLSLHLCSANFATQQLKKKETRKAAKVAIKKSTANERFEELMRNKIKYSLNIYVPRIQYICGGPASGDHTHTHTHAHTAVNLAGLTYGRSLT